MVVAAVTLGALSGSQTRENLGSVLRRGRRGVRWVERGVTEG